MGKDWRIGGLSPNLLAEAFGENCLGLFERGQRRPRPTAQCPRKSSTTMRANHFSGSDQSEQWIRLISGVSARRKHLRFQGIFGPSDPRLLCSCFVLGKLADTSGSKVLSVARRPRPPDGDVGSASCQMADSQMSSARPQKRDAICVDL